MRNIDKKFTKIYDKEVVYPKEETPPIQPLVKLKKEDQKIYKLEFKADWLSLLALQKQVTTKNETSFENKFYKLWWQSIVTFFLAIVLFIFSSVVRDYINNCKTNKCCYFFVCDKRVNYEK